MPNSLFNRFVQSLGALKRPKGSESSQIHLAIFGKHPGWDDHIPGFGLSQPEMIDFKRWLYDGIIRNVDSGDWDKLKKSGQLQPFNHTILEVSPHECIIARCWKSVDGKGRDQYPMIAAALCSKLPISWILREVLPGLRTLEGQLTAAKTAAEVENLFLPAENGLRQSLSGNSGTSSQPPAVDPFTYLAGRAEMGADHLGFLRLMYHIEREMPPAPGGTRLLQQKSISAPRSFSMRVPLCADSGLAAAELWMRLLSSNPEMPPALVACVADSASYLDLMVGVPTGAQLYCLRAPVEVLPLTTDVPYTLDPGFVSRVNAFIEAHQNRQNNSPVAEWP